MSLLACLWILSSCQGPGSAADPAAQAKPKNILFLFADDQRPDSLGAMGNPHIETPHLDALAARGTLVRDNYCMGSRHGAVCAPSRAMLMTGRPLPRIQDNMQGAPTLPQVLRQQGFRCYATGKWHNGQPAFKRSFDVGRQVMLGGMSDHNAVPVRDYDEASQSFGPKRTGQKISTTLFADAALELMAGHRKEHADSPFFMYVSFTAPHDPRDPPAAWRQRYYDKQLPLPKNFRPQVEWMGDGSWGRVRDERLAAWPRTEQVVRDQLAEYYGLISHMDAEIGRVLAWLEAQGLREETLVVFAADHGLAMGSHGLLGKQNLFEHSMGCPLILAGPGIPVGREVRAMSYLYDLFPTLCSLVEAPLPEGVEGVDLLPVLRGAQERARETLFTLYRKSQRAIRDRRYKLIRYPEIDKTLLFDLQEDPDEIEDLAARPELQVVRQGLLQDLRRWQAAVGDNAPLTAPKLRPAQVDLSGRARQPDRWQPAWIRAKYF